jgi:CAAX protease family protein
VFISLFGIADSGWNLGLSLETHIVWASFAYCAVVAATVLAMRLTRVPIRESLGLARLRLRDIPLGVGAAVLLSFVLPGVIALIHALIGSWPWPTPNQPLSGPMMTLLSLEAIIIAPLAEELIFRGFMYRSLQASLGSIAALLITALTFGLTHKLYGYGWDHVAMATFIGLALGSLRWWTGGIAASFVCHAILNSTLISTVLSFFERWFQ